MALLIIESFETQQWQLTIACNTRTIWEKSIRSFRFQPIRSEESLNKANITPAVTECCVLREDVVKLPDEWYGSHKETLEPINRIVI